mgnify:CR=1 FL=1
MSDRYIIGKQYCEGFADAIRPVAIDESKGPHWMAGYNDGYRFRSNKNELLNQYMAKIGRKPFGIIRLAATEADVIGGFPYADPNCKGCGKALAVENAWMTDGCPCNTPLGVNSMNETRWRLLMQSQQEQSREIARLRADVERKDEALRSALAYIRLRRTDEILTEITAALASIDGKGE